MKIQRRMPRDPALSNPVRRLPHRICPFIAGSITLGLLSLCISPAAWAQQVPPPSVASAAAILVDGQSGKVLWAKDDRQAKAPASLTKILTALVVLENADLGSKVTISRQARAAGGSRTYAEAGWAFTVEDLLYGLLLPSGNDAAIALAQKVSPDGTEEGFLRMANRRAADMGATSTHFVNSHGLDQPGHVTSARDMALVTMTALRNPTFARIVSTKRHVVKWGDGSTRSFRNHNKLLTRYPGTVGVKTGYTNQARHTLASAVRRNGATLVAVTMGSSRQYDDSVSLFDWGFANLAALRGRAVDEIWPPKPAAPQPAGGGPGSDLVADTLRLLESLGGSATGPRPVSAPVFALSSFLGASLAAAGFVAVRSQRRIRRQLILLRVPNVQVSAPSDLPYPGQ